MASPAAPSGAISLSNPGLAAGMRTSLPVIVAVLPFGLLYGALAAQQGLSPFDAALMSATIFGGASQMVGIELFGKQISPWWIVLSIFAVNFRHVLYSATLGRRIRHWPAGQKALGFFFLTDAQFAEAERLAEAGKPVGFAWYMGLSLPIYLTWVAESYLGAAFGKLIGDTHAIGIDFLLPIYFLGLVMEFHKRPLWLPVVAASAAASILAYWTVGSPWHVSLGALAGVALAAAMPPKPITSEPPVGGDVP
ncbi:MAG: AzlC family ABC transporter permease [Rhizobiaceae bacterium]|nr:AzlC family ABC transporter permease [Rhizobiaceae bacterium]